MGSRRALRALAGTLAMALFMAAVAIANGGTSDQEVTGAPAWLSLYGVAMRDNGSVFIVGSRGQLMVSNDQGKTWNLQNLHQRPGNVLFQDGDLYAIRFTPDGHSGWIVGEKGLILHSDDDGVSWRVQTSNVTGSLFNLSVVDAQHAYACGEDGVLLSTVDGGNSWKAFKFKEPITFFDISYTDRSSGWAVGEFEAILHTTDGGNNWNLSNGALRSDFTVGPYFSIVLTEPEHALVVGLGGVVGTADGGKSWTPQKLPEMVAWYAAAQTGGQIWLGGQGGRLARPNAAREWVVTRPTFSDVSGVAFSGKTGYAVGLNGTILRTDSAGEQWQAVR
jgi:photosystem II stability/assembly factor-like uncharacterized protein